MRKFSLCHSLSSLVAALALMAANPAHAQLIAPVGLNPGDTFRFVFLTPDSTAATSTSILTYDAFANTQAGGVTYNGVPLTWQAIGSTAGVSAASHIGNNAGLHGIYLTSGLLLSAGPESQLWSQQTIQHAINVGPTGSIDNANPDITVWTGSNADGTASGTPLGFLSHGVAQVTFADATALDSGWITGPTGQGGVGEEMYAISNVVTVSGSPAATPEPGAWAMFVGLGCTGGRLFLRRRRVRKSA